MCFSPSLHSCWLNWIALYFVPSLVLFQFVFAWYLWPFEGLISRNIELLYRLFVFVFESWSTKTAFSCLVLIEVFYSLEEISRIENVELYLEENLMIWHVLWFPILYKIFAFNVTFIWTKCISNQHLKLIFFCPVHYLKMNIQFS